MEVRHVPVLSERSVAQNVEPEGWSLVPAEVLDVPAQGRRDVERWRHLSPAGCFHHGRVGVHSLVSPEVAFLHRERLENQWHRLVPEGVRRLVLEAAFLHAPAEGCSFRWD